MGVGVGVGMGVASGVAVGTCVGVVVTTGAGVGVAVAAGVTHELEMLLLTGAAVAGHVGKLQVPDTLVWAVAMMHVVPGGRLGIWFPLPWHPISVAVQSARTDMQVIYLFTRKPPPKNSLLDTT
jgi:hypothetical protein